jgi:hypothetical protein
VAAEALRRHGERDDRSSANSPHELNLKPNVAPCSRRARAMRGDVSGTYLSYSAGEIDSVTGKLSYGFTPVGH